LPQTGTLTAFDVPTGGGHVRVDTGVATGDTISVHYDPMIAKVVAWAETRELAAAELGAALAGTDIAGVVTNINFLTDTLGHPAFLATELDTHFIERHEADLLGDGAEPPTEAFAAAVSFILEESRLATTAAAGDDPNSPWAASDGFRLNHDLDELYSFQQGDETVEAHVIWERDGRQLHMASGVAAFAYQVPDAPGLPWSIRLGDRSFQARIARVGLDIVAGVDGRRWRLSPVALGAAAAMDGGGGSLSAPMPGKIVRVEASAGQTVKKGDALLALEAMKMEHVITAPANGVVEAINCAVGDQVEEGVELVAFVAAGA
jgi:3-methylcrotonyl-CoA carboxylase alpha subunit